MASTIPAARTALHAGLVALQASSLAGVGVYRTGSWDERADYDVIAVLNARNIRREYRASGATFFEEEYTIPVVIQVFGAGDDVAVVETRLWALVTIIEAFVLSSGSGQANLGVTGVQTAHPVGLLPPGEESGPTDQDVLLAKGTVDIRVRAIVDV